MQLAKIHMMQSDKCRALLDVDLMNNVGRGQDHSPSPMNKTPHRDFGRGNVRR